MAYAIAGTVDIDLVNEPLGVDSDGNDVYLADLWPTQEEVAAVVAASVNRDQFITEYGAVFDGSAEWQDVQSSTGSIYSWDAESTYVQEPPFFVDLAPDPTPVAPINGARVLLKLGDSVTTDHISPAGAIAAALYEVDGLRRTRTPMGVHQPIQERTTT